MVKRALLVGFLILALLVGAGCWNRRDPELLAIVLALAFDYDEEKDMHLVIAQIANPQAMQEDGAGGAAGGERRPFWVVSSYGHTPFEAMRNMTTGSSRELFWAHNRVILFSEKAARRGIREVIDVMERERQVRVIARPAVVEGDIRKLMEAEFPLEETGARGLDRQMVTIQFDKSVFHTKHLNEIFSALEAPGLDASMGKIKVLNDNPADQQEDRDNANASNGDNSGNTNNRSSPPAMLGGMALFKEDRLVGWATQKQAEGWLLALGRGQRFSFVLECPDEPQCFFSVEIFHTSVHLEPVVENGKPHVRIRAKATSRIQNYTGGGDLEAEGHLITSLKQRTAEAIRRRIEEMIALSQELNADVIGFGNLFYRKQPAYWKEVEEQWDIIFPALTVEVQVQINIMRTGLVKDSLNIR